MFSKQKCDYIQIVSFVLNSMLDALSVKGYSFNNDLRNYYENQIRPDNILNDWEFENLISNILKTRGIRVVDLK